MLQSLDVEELKRLFEERLREQKERHDGGNRSIGAGARAPRRQRHAPHRRARGPQGRRSQRHGGGRRARVPPVSLGPRARRPADRGRAAQAARVSPRGRRAGAHLEETINETAKNAGELEIVLRPPRKPNVRVLLLMDVGGSMDPHASW